MMKLLLFVFCSSYLFSNVIDSTQYKLTVYPELIGLGGLPSINIEYPLGDYSIRAGVGMVVAQAITTPVAIYKINDRGRSKRELGLGLFIAMPEEIAIAVLLNWRTDSKDRRKFKRVGIIFGLNDGGYPIILPTLGWGFNF